MNDHPHSVVVERILPHTPATVWHALTEKHMLKQWLMETDFEPTLGKQFTFHGDWGTATCKILQLQQDRLLSYSWDALGVQTVVTWTLTETEGGTLVRMEQSGFDKAQNRELSGAKQGWSHFFERLERILN